MIDYKEKLKIEKEFISLLLQNKDLVVDWLNGQLSIKYFDDAHQLILRAITAACNEDVLLTRKTFLSFIKKNVKSKMDIQAQEHVFNVSNMLNVDVNDYPELKNKIFEASVDRSTIRYIEEYQKDNEIKGGLFAAKKLAGKLNDLVIDTSTEKKIYYESVRDYAPQYYEKMIERREKKDGDDTIKCHIKEIDETLVVGFTPGSLILFCGDVGGYKCGHYENLQYLTDGSRITLENLWRKIQSGEKVKLMQFNHKSGQIDFNSVLDMVNSGKKECYRITTKLGHEIISTLDHRHLSWGGYVPVADLIRGDFLAVSRKSPFGECEVDIAEATVLGGLISEGGTTTGCSFTNEDARIVKEMKKSCKSLRGGMSCKHLNGIRLGGQYGIRGMKWLIDKYGIKCKAIDKKIHSSVFSWNKISISNLLKMMYSGDGSFITEDKNGRQKYKIIYCTSSQQLAKDVRDLLLKFGILASIVKYKSYYTKNGIKIDKGFTWHVNISDVRQIILFAEQIGFIGNKQLLLDKNIVNIKNICPNPNDDISPPGIWSILDEKFKKYKKSRTGCRRFYRKGNYDNWKKDLGHCGNIGKGISREALKKIAIYLNNDAELLSIANSDIYWDKIVNIEYVGREQTYDVCMPNDHNFISNNMVTHNSTMMLNVAINVWELSHKNVLYVPLEMPREMMYQKMLSRQKKIPFEFLQHPKLLSETQVQQIKGFGSEIFKIEEDHGCSFYIMEAPEQIAVSVIKREIEKNIDIFKPNLIVVDYIANLIPDGNTRRERDDLEIGAMLKYLRTMGKVGAVHNEGFSVVSGAQLGREGLKRYRKSGSKGVFYSEDIHGSHQYSADADAMYAQMKPQQSNDNTRIEFIQIKSRYGKNIFSNGSNKTMLEVKPDIGLIQSINTSFYNEKHDEIMSKINDVSVLDFSEEDKQKDNTSEIDKLLFS